MSKPRPPTPPSPTETAAAQTGVNIGTAVANTQMGQVNQVTPDGSLMYSQTGSQTYTDPSTGRTYAIPQYTATTSLSPAAQAIRDQSNAASLNMATLAANQSGRADQLLSQPFSLDSVPGGADRSGFGPATYSPNLAAPQFTQGATPLPQMGQGGVMPQGSAPSAMPSLMRSGGVPQLSQAAGLPQASQAAGLPQGTQAGNLPQLSQGAMMPGASQGTAGPQFGQVGTNANLQDSYTPEGGFSADRQRVEDALMGRLGTQRDRDMEALRTQLLNQGVNIGSEAYSRAMQDFDRTNTDMRTSAILASGQEQSRLLGEARGAGQFTNEARQAGFQNQLTGTGFNNAANLQGYQLAEDQRRYGDAMGLQRFGMGEDMRRYDDAQRASQFGMGEDVRRYQDQFGLTQYGLGEDARRYQDQFGMAQFSAGEDVRRNQDAQRIALFGLGEQARQSDNQMALAQYGLSEDARRYQDQFAMAQYGLAEDRSRYGDQFGMAQFGMSEDQRRYGDAMAQQQFGNQQAIQGRGDAIAGTQFAQQQSIFDAQDNARARALQEQLALRNQPINEITALMSGSQVNTPQFGIAQSAMIPTTDFAGITQQGFSNQMANYQQQNANYQAMLGGLFGMGSAAITAGFPRPPSGGSDIRIKADIEPHGERNGHNWYKFRYVWEDPGTVHEGVMAQEVMQTRPDAVSKHPMGFYVVDYAALGLEMV